MHRDDGAHDLITILVGHAHRNRDVAGGWYDAFTLAQDSRLGLVIADVCDKGVGAALFMALVRSLIRAFSDQHYARWGRAALEIFEPHASG